MSNSDPHFSAGSCDLIERLRNPMWAHSAAPFLSPQLEQEENLAAMNQAAAEIESALGYAQRLATGLWEKHWKADAPDWKPLPELIGVLTQIDNATAGLIRGDAQGWQLIETALRDEELLLGWWREWPERQWEMASGLAGSTKGGWLHGQATHWQRLPGPPCASQPSPAATVEELRAFCRPLLGDVGSANDRAFERLLGKMGAPAATVEPKIGRVDREGGWNAGRGIAHECSSAATEAVKEAIAQALLDRFIERGFGRLGGPTFPQGTKMSSLPSSYADDFYMDADAVLAVMPAVPQPSAGNGGEPVSLINRRLTDLAEANALYGKDQRLGAPDKVARNNREISWLKELRSIILTEPQGARK